MVINEFERPINIGVVGCKSKASYIILYYIIFEKKDGSKNRYEKNRGRDKMPSDVFKAS